MSYSNKNNAVLLLDPLSLSIGLDDCFDFVLDDSARNFFSESVKTNADEDLADILGDSNFSANIDRMFEDDSPIEYASACFDLMQEKSQPPPPSLLKQGMHQVQTVKTNFSHGYNCVRAKSRRRNSQPHSVQEVEVGKIKNFDPTPYDHEKYQKMKRVSYNDLDVLMEANNSSASSRRRSNKGSNSMSRRSGRSQRRAIKDYEPMPSQPKRRRVSLDPKRYSLDGNGMMLQQDHHKALQKLADSMKRSELSRRQLEMHRTATAAAEVQQRIHNFAQQQLSRVAGSNHYGRSISNDSLNMIADQQQQRHHSISPNHNNDRSSVMEAFFSGSRGTLTNGLEQSRRQLSIIMLAGQMDTHAFQ